MQQCPCGSSSPYIDCCGRFINGNEMPTTPEELMRSRYTAFTLADVDYIANTMKSPAADDFDKKETRDWAGSVDWIRLEVVRVKMDSAQKGFVEFAAYFEEKGGGNVIHELSEFHRIDGAWFYVSGSVPIKQETSSKASSLGRNAICPCGSGKKVKRCCGG